MQPGVRRDMDRARRLQTRHLTHDECIAAGRAASVPTHVLRRSGDEVGGLLPRSAH